MKRYLYLMAMFGLAACASVDGGSSGTETAARCVPVGGWLAGDGRPIEAAALFDRAHAVDFVLLGETHDRAAHHRWQAEVIAELRARRPELAVGLEMLPRRAQGALDRYVAGAVDQAGFLEESAWKESWGFDFALYRPIFAYAREHGIPLIALNVDRSLVREVGQEGFDAVAARTEMPVGRPADPMPGYVSHLAEVYAAHADGRTPAADDPAFRRFVDAQLLWDRAMAEALAQAHDAGGHLVVGVMGAGHVENGYGVPHQLAALGKLGVLTLLPWDAERSCGDLSPHLADAVYGIGTD